MQSGHFVRCKDEFILLQPPVDKTAYIWLLGLKIWRCVYVSKCRCVCLCFCCWLFILESCCVLGAITAVSSANVISRSVGCESISFLGTITEDCRLFPPLSVISVPTFESIHCALLSKHTSARLQTRQLFSASHHVTFMTDVLKKAFHFKTRKNPPLLSPKSSGGG